MTKAEIGYRAHSIVYELIQNYFDVGQPFNDMGDENPDATALADALERIQLRHIRGEIKNRAAIQRRKEKAK